MFILDLNADDYIAEAERLGATMEQLPFILSQSLNRALIQARQVLVQNTWPSHVTQRNPSFLTASLQMVFSTKYNVTVEINDQPSQGRGHLALHAHGGTKVAHGGRLAIPSAAVKAKLGPHGLPVSAKPATMKRKVVIGNRIFQASGSGKNSKLALVFSLWPQANQPADVPFETAFESAIRDGMRTSFADAVFKAMRSAR